MRRSLYKICGGQAAHHIARVAASSSAQLCSLLTLPSSITYRLSFIPHRLPSVIFNLVALASCRLFILYSLSKNFIDPTWFQ